NLRGALLGVMRRAVCAGDPDDPAHVAVCPVCWLAAANERPGVERRGYALVPPLGVPEVLEAGDPFAFHLTLFGDAIRYLPYFLLAIPEVGRVGVGPGRGKFALRRVWAERLNADDWAVLKEGETTVTPPPQSGDHADVLAAAQHMLPSLQTGQGRLTLRFHTPLRLIHQGRLLKAPDFGVFFARLLERLDHLAVQHAAGTPRPPEAREALGSAADRVRLVEDRTRWVEVSSGSRRTNRRTWLSGLVGSAVYTAPPAIWEQLLPWLLWGQIAQVGKDTPKGNGFYAIEGG
ncbi:MAG: CRISPR system precrRNA processing endoribonuclease RAMP protein Cas6, partial [Anaerolineae bacterium]